MPRPQRTDVRSAAEKLLETGEALFGLHGLDGVSLRQIGAMAGSGNNYAVQYHFGDAAGLVRAILARRMAEADRLQEALLVELEAAGRAGDVRALLDMLLRPLLQPKDSRGERVYARFIVALLSSRDGPRYCRELFHLAPATGRLQALLFDAVQAPPPILLERLRLIAILVLSSVFNRLTPAGDAADDEALIDDALDVAAAGLVAPVRPNLLAGSTRPARSRGPGRAAP